MTTGERMKVRRKELGLSAEYIAEQLGCSASTIYRYEKGDIEKLPVDALKPLAAVLHTTPSYLMGLNDAWNDEIASLASGSTSPLILAKPQPTNSIRIAGRDGSLVERQLTDEQLALFQSMLDQMKPIDDESV